ncbi:VWA domain-containing protein [Paractinoplanes rhizophilus]|uniref:VWA domain-containing protein n=1 Tax=Paractinoplanes rhizophilus TaxID=1416877 RepID=A0ABW2HTN3_9ACTN
MLLDLVAAVRAAGVPATPDRVQAMFRAVDATGPRLLYWAARLTLCGSPDDVARFDAAFAGFTRDAEPKGTPWQVRRLPERALFRSQRPPDETLDGDSGLAVRAGDAEVLRHRDLATLSAAERAEAMRLLTLAAAADPRRPGRRYRPWPRGRPDPPRTMRAMLRAAGEPRLLARRSRRPRPRRLVLLADVSGSMAPYADALLRLGHALVRNRPRWTEVYTLGTRLTRVTPSLRTRDVEAALLAAGQAIPDWRGGTRLADTLTEFLRRHGHRGVARRAVVVVFSDGWERGDPADLGVAAAHVRRLAHRLIWATPHAARPGFAPTAGGLAAVLPHVDALVAGHSIAAITALLDEVSI